MDRMWCAQKWSIASILLLAFFPMHAFASAFQLFEQDGASVGEYHAGYAAAATDASTAFYNPAGLVRFKEQQAIISADSITTDFTYKGTVSVNTISSGAPSTVTAQGGNFNLIPALQYVAPLNDTFGFGFSVDVPFGLKTTYGRSTQLQYAATTAAITVVDISPSLGVRLFRNTSCGIGFDVARSQASFEQPGGLGDPPETADSQNSFTGTGYGGHAGLLYEFSEKSRVGVSYHSQIVQHLTGTSWFTGSLADAFSGGPFSSHAYLNITLPAYTAFSGYHELSDRFTILGSAIYTGWRVARELIMYNISGIQNLDPSSDITITVPEYYRNTWNLSIGSRYRINDDIFLRFGLGYDQTPVPNAYRNVTLPDNNRKVVAFGGHYQSTKTLGFDLSWSHLFLNQSSINPPVLVAGDQQVTTVGHVNGGADVLAIQATWEMV